MIITHPARIPCSPPTTGDTLLVDLGEPLERAVPGLFDVVRERACRELVTPQMILKAFAAVALSRTSRVAAIAEVHVLRKVRTFHTLFHLSVRSCA